MALEQLLHVFTDPCQDPVSKIHFSATQQYPIGAPSANIYLTMREAQVMVLMMMGKTSKQIGWRLEISDRTVEYYTRNMRRKLGCRTKGALIEIALESQFLANVFAKQDTE